MTQRLPEPERVQKLLAAEGLGSRRGIEELIRCRRVRINSRTAELGDRVSVRDKVYVDGLRVLIREILTPRIIAYHKPCGEVVSRSSRNHRTVFERLPQLEHGRWVAVGRLDVNTSGVLLLCNDGELAHRLMHPSYQLPRTYRARVAGQVTDAVIRNLLGGVMLGNRFARFESIERRRCAGGLNCWFEVMLREGRNREVRRLWQSQQIEVNRLIRTDFAGIDLGTRTGVWRELARKESEKLYREVGLQRPHWER